MVVSIIISVIIAYLIGSINSAVIISKSLAGFDVREKGSGNAGSTNMLRSVGRGAAALTLICDVLKGVVAVLVAVLIGKITKVDASVLAQFAGAAVIIGHTYPIFFGFKGGKGVATSLGVLLIINWNIGLVCLIFALALMAFTRIVSLGSISAAVLFPLLVIFMPSEAYITKGNYIAFAIIIAALVIFNHRTNVERLLKGKENKLDMSMFKSKKGSKKQTAKKAETKTEAKGEKTKENVEIKNDAKTVKKEVKQEEKKDKKEDKEIKKEENKKETKKVQNK